MGINHQTQFNNITSAQNRLVNFNQGGALTRIYRNYEFTPNTESMWDFEVAKEYAEISKELISVLSNDRVVCICAAWKKKKLEKCDFWERWTPPVFIEDGKMQQLKQELKEGKWGKPLWADYMWYEQTNVKTLFLNLNSTNRFYCRDIIVVEENIDFALLDRMNESSFETIGGVGIRIFPHSKIEYKGNDEETIHTYAQRKDFIAEIAVSFKLAMIVIEINHNYMDYKQILEIIEPLFEKRGIKIKDKTDPYIYANYPPDYIEYNEHPCAGYEFID